MATHIPGGILDVDRSSDEYIVITIENVSGERVRFRVTDANKDVLWAAGEYWDALKAHGETLLGDIEDEMRDMGLWDEDEDEDEI